jgi:autophagy-related protein 18
MKSTIVVRISSLESHRMYIYLILAYDDVCIIERLFSSSLTALVSNQAPRKLKVCHFKKGTEICSYSFANTILAVKLNRLVRMKKKKKI